MKKLLLPLFLITCLWSTAQQYTAGVNEKDADALLDKLQLQTATAQDRITLQQAAAAFRENAQRLDETNHDYKKALQQVDKAVIFYEALGDTLNLAFSRKYKAHLLVRLNKLPQAKAELRAAIQLYRLTATGAGIASSQLDLARVFEFESKSDSAIYYADASRAYWKQQENSLQDLVINNMMVYHLLQQNQTEKAEAIYQESALLLKQQPAHWQPLLDFYFTSMLLFRQTNDVTNAAHYRDLYRGKMDALQKQGITGRSYYEAFGQ